MAVTRDTFVAAFPAFASLTTYPAATFDFWLEQAGDVVEERRFGKAVDRATMFFVAHYLTLAARDAASAASGASTGTVQGPVNSKSVDKVSVGYDSGSVTIDKAGLWNLTTFGIQFYRMAQAAATGGVYVQTYRRLIF